jgi:hypothetical protein
MGRVIAAAKMDERQQLHAMIRYAAIVCSAVREGLQL